MNAGLGRRHLQINKPPSTNTSNTIDHLASISLMVPPSPVHFRLPHYSIHHQPRISEEIDMQQMSASSSPASSPMTTHHTDADVNEADEEIQSVSTSNSSTLTSTPVSTSQHLQMSPIIKYNTIGPIDSNELSTSSSESSPDVSTPMLSTVRTLNSSRETEIERKSVPLSTRSISSTIQPSQTQPTTPALPTESLTQHPILPPSPVVIPTSESNEEDEQESPLLPERSIQSKHN